MATFTLTQDTNIDALTNRTGGDVIVPNGFSLTIDQDSRYGLNSTTTASLGAFTTANISDNAKYGLVVRSVGGDDLGGGLAIPPYFFLQGGWRVRPMEANHDLVITGNLFVEGGGIPVVRTLGQFQVNVNYTVPVQAQAFIPTGAGGSSGLTLAQIEASTVLAKEATVAAKASQASVTALGTPLQASAYTAPNNTNIAAAVWSAPTRTLTVTDTPVGTRSVRLQQLLRNKG
jgi:hypothetical protein